MFGILIQYEYSGDESEWRQAVDSFIAQINADDRLQGRFTYQVKTHGEDGGRIHVGHWDDEETLAHLQSQPFFVEFSGKVQGFAGDSLKATKFTNVTSTEN